MVISNSYLNIAPSNIKFNGYLEVICLFHLVLYESVGSYINKSTCWSVTSSPTTLNNKSYAKQSLIFCKD